jgi:hypothetical protein
MVPLEDDDSDDDSEDEWAEIKQNDPAAEIEPQCDPAEEESDPTFSSDEESESDEERPFGKFSRNFQIQSWQIGRSSRPSLRYQMMCSFTSQMLLGTMRRLSR